MNEWINLHLNSAMQKWLLIILLLLLFGYFLYLVMTQIRIWIRKRSMTDYAYFVVRTYERDKIPQLIMRYYLREVEAYNKLRQKTPFRFFWKELDSDRLLALVSRESRIRQK